MAPRRKRKDAEGSYSRISSRARDAADSPPAAPVEISRDEKRAAPAEGVLREGGAGWASRGWRRYAVGQ